MCGAFLILHSPLKSRFSQEAAGHSGKNMPVVETGSAIVSENLYQQTVVAQRCDQVVSPSASWRAGLPTDAPSDATFREGSVAKSAADASHFVLPCGARR